MGLLGKLGGVAKEAGRGALVNGVLGITGNSSMTGQVQYPEYEYDANGHIKGVSSKYAIQIANTYSGGGTSIDGVDGKFGGLGASTSVRTKNLAAQGTSYPAKFMDSDAAAKLSKIQEPPLPQYKEEKEGDFVTSINNMSAAAQYDNAVAKSIEDRKKVGSTYGMLYNDVSVRSNKNSPDNKINDEHNSDIYSLKLPDWTYADFINERAIWQKGLSSALDEPGWFYFKIFFNFNTNHGLFGGILNSEKFTQATNSAAKYLYTINKNHRQIKAKDRINALHKFTSILSFISDNAPWYFKEVKGLNNAVSSVINDFSKERSIEIGVTQDAIDMRLSTLMSLYNYACFDNMLNKEVVPENLRKFDMTIIIFQTPLRYLHTSFTSNKKMEFMGVDVGAVIDEVGGIFGKKKKGKLGTRYKSMTPTNGDSQNFGDLMSMKIYSFTGCEFDMESFASIIPGQMTNENPFQLGNSSIKIKFTKCIEHTMNEFYGIMWGADGFYFNQYNNFQLADSSFNGYVHKENSGWEKQQERYQALKDTLDDLTQGGTILGLIDSPKSYKKAIDATEAVMNGLFDNGGMLKGLATNFALGLLGSSLNTQAPQGNIYGDVGIGSAYFKDKVEMLKNGVHERTMAPYYYDPDTGVRRDLHVDKDYSSLDYKNLKTQVSNFNLNNFLQTNTQKFASKINDKVREGVDKLFGYNNDFTEKPYRANPYNSENAANMDAKRFEGIGKSHLMVDDPNIHTYVTAPFNYDSTEAVNYENSKAGGKYKSQDMVDNTKNNPPHQFTVPPYKI